MSCLASHTARTMSRTNRKKFSTNNRRDFKAVPIFFLLLEGKHLSFKENLFVLAFHHRNPPRTQNFESVFENGGKRGEGGRGFNVLRASQISSINHDQILSQIMTLHSQKVEYPTTIVHTASLLNNSERTKFTLWFSLPRTQSKFVRMFCQIAVCSTNNTKKIPFGVSDRFGFAQVTFIVL